MIKFEHTTLVLNFARKAMGLTRKDLLQGLSSESEKAFKDAGESGWELVSVVPYAAGGLAIGGMSAATDSALGFFKRAKA